MWISRKKWEEMQRRVDALEQWQQWQGTIHVNDSDDCPSHTAKLSVVTAIYKILDHLGLKLEYVDGRQSTVKISAAGRSQESK
jgi:hypothetical protein